MTAVAVLCACLATWLAVSGPSRPPLPWRAPALRPEITRLRPLVAVGAGCGAWVVVEGASGVAAGIAASFVAWTVLARAEPSAVRREREAAQRELPHLVDLLAATLHSGSDPIAGLQTVCAALPGAAARRLAPVMAHAHLGATDAWRLVAEDEVLEPLGRALARSQRTGASVVETVERLADELEREVAAAAEDRARRVGVAAAVPLGICLLPAFMLLGIAPTVAALLGSITA